MTRPVKMTSQEKQDGRSEWDDGERSKMRRIYFKIK